MHSLSNILNRCYKQDSDAITYSNMLTLAEHLIKKTSHFKSVSKLSPWSAITTAEVGILNFIQRRFFWFALKQTFSKHSEF